ncbi:phospholipase A2, membrane associated [Orycteropus afer afer]|uniref:Phospholipase A2 n=1 Tax=Orycteropus afer afer TaxID=1230840 RepID=A0A8B6ZEF7_ORYAF|nr:phospholipase A2, membrane associated [Orycteropus afer afer]
MKNLLLLAAIMALSLLQVQGNLLDFGRMIRFTTGKHPAYDYGFYGCYCGYGGRGTPKDNTDWCCREHDCCYDRLEFHGCSTKLQTYNFDIQGSRIVCGGQNLCERLLCQCDKTAAYCLARNLNTYKEKFRFYPNWWCSGNKPSCERQRPLLHDV